jgi:PiT family inorganic phosphate transporter
MDYARNQAFWQKKFIARLKIICQQAHMLTVLLLLATAFLAYSNGANDNFKGVASLYGSKTCSYRTAITWATITTFAGSVVSIFLAEALLKRFSGKGLVPDQFTESIEFLLAVALGSGATVILATILGFPVSTTHGLTGAMVGAGLVAAGSKVNFGVLGKSFFLPLGLSPVLAIGVAAIIYLLFHVIRVRMGISKEWCVCIGGKQEIVAIPQPASIMAFQAAAPLLSISTGEMKECSQRYSGTFLGLRAQHIMDGAHFLSAGIVSFARGLNDTPKIAAMLLVLKGLDIKIDLVSIACAMAIGGWLNARKVAETMSKKITAMNHGQGFCANLATGILVILASKFGLPVSTTHVSVGALFGIGLTTNQANPKVILGILLSWILTLPCAAILAAMAYWVLR